MTFTLIPPLHAYVHRVTITDRCSDDGQQAVGLIYRFLANITDAGTIPRVANTTVFVEPWETLGSRATSALERTFNPREGVTSEPWIWRFADNQANSSAADQGGSEPAASVPRQKARNCWNDLAGCIRRQIGTMRLIGLHEDIIARAADPLRLREIEIRTLRHDMLALMVAMGSAEIARCADVLRGVDEKTNDRKPLYKTTFENFLWPVDAEIPEWARTKYDSAIADGYCERE
jgi:hypothetical protein